MKKIKKSDIKAIRKGNHAKLMDCLDFLLDSYDEDKYDLGYKACISDIGVRSQLLAEHIIDFVVKNGSPAKDKNNETVFFIDDKNKLSDIIEEYFIDSLK